MDKQFYTEYYDLERNHWWFKVRSGIIEDSVKTINKSPLNILNIGVATGKTSEILSQFGNVTSVEFDTECCRFTSEKLGIDIINASILNLPFSDNKFDLVCAFDVLEHVENDQKAVSEMKRVCVNNGHICITVPAFMHLWSHHDDVNMHLRRYTMKGVLALFKGSGKIIAKTYFNSFLYFPIMTFRILSRLIPPSMIRKGAGSDFTLINNESPVNKLLYKIFNFERKLLKKIEFPVGVSILCIWKKD